MVDFTNQYQPPGIYVDEVLTPVITPVSSVPSVPALVGPSPGFRTQTERITLTGTDPVTLSKRGINEDSLEVSSISGDTLTETTDWVSATTSGENAEAGYTYDDETTIARVDTGEIADGDIVYVTYNYTDEQFISPSRLPDKDAVVALYGPAIDFTTGEILSPLTLAASIAFDNGAPSVICVPTLSDTPGVATADSLQAAYAKLAAMPEAGIVVGLPVGITGTAGDPGNTLTVASHLEQHVDAASIEGYYRVGIIGFESSVTVPPDTIAQGNVSRRLMVAYPNRLNYYNGETNQNIELSGYYLAAAYAGQLARRAPQEGLTKKVIRGFASLPGSVVAGMTKTVKNNYSAAGVAVTEATRDGRLVVRHGVTTDPTSVLTSEISLVRARDTLVTALELTFDRSGLIGSPITQDTPFQIKAAASGILEAAKDSGLIQSYVDLRVRQTTIDPTVIEVKFAYKPSYPLNYIVISFTVDTTSGEVSFNLPIAA